MIDGIASESFLFASTSTEKPLTFLLSELRFFIKIQKYYFHLVLIH